MGACIDVTVVRGGKEDVCDDRSVVTRKDRGSRVARTELQDVCLHRGSCVFCVVHLRTIRSPCRPASASDVDGPELFECHGEG